MSGVVILLMLLAVMAMVKKVDNDRQGQAILASDSRETDNGIRPQTARAPSWNRS